MYSFVCLGYFIVLDAHVDPKFLTVLNIFLLKNCLLLSVYARLVGGTSSHVWKRVPWPLFRLSSQLYIA